jgi:hypothetical protein
MNTAAPASLPTPIVPRLQVIMVVPEHGVDAPPMKLKVARTKVTPAGSASVTRTFGVGLGPLLMTFIPYVRSFPTVAGLGMVVLVMDKSAVAA